MRTTAKGGARFLLAASALTISLFLIPVVFATSARAQCIPLTASQMFLDPSTLPDGEIGVFYSPVELPGPGTITITPGPSSVVGLKIAPPEMLSPGDAYVPTVDYSACIDPSSGSGAITFSAEGAYAVRIDYASDPSKYLIVGVGAKDLNKCFATGDLKEFDCPAPPKAYEGKDVDTPPDFASQTSVTSVMDLVTQVTADAAAGAIDLVLVDHGCEGAIFINGEKVSTDPADAPNLTKFCSMKGKVKSVSLLSCSTAHGTAGSDFLKALSKCLGGVSVTGFTGNVRSFNRNGKRHWGSFGTAVTLSTPVPVQTATWGSLKAIYR